MKLTQEQRDEIRFAFEDAGMPEVLAFMAGEVATTSCFGLGRMNGKPSVWSLCPWYHTPQGYEFWRAVAANFGQDLYA